jgi:hypothetical protein
VVYDDGAFDYYESVEPVPTLLLELEWIIKLEIKLFV